MISPQCADGFHASCRGIDRVSDTECDCECHSGHNSHMTTSSISAYLDYMGLQRRSPETIAVRRMFLRRLERHLGADPQYATIGALVAWRRTLTAGDRAIVSYLSHLRAYYDFLIDSGRRADNPSLAIPMPRCSRLLPRPVDEPDLFRAMTQAPQPIRIWLALAAWCGLRCKEIALLRRECVRERAAVPVIIVAAGATKGISGERAIPICSQLRAELELIRLPSSGWVFRRADGQPGPNRPSRVSQAVGNYLRSQEIPASAHMLRHRFGTCLYEQTGDIRLVQEMMGHASPATTTIYTKVRPARAAAALELLPRLPEPV
jgi:integrase/recombinase XerC